VSGFDERLFFDHDLATPFSNLQGAAYLLRMALGDPSPEAEEALEILENNTHALCKMLHWYWELRGLEGPAPPEPPWPVERLPQELAHCARAHRLPLPIPEVGGGLAGLRSDAPSSTLVLAFTGAALTLRAASGAQPEWLVEGVDGVLRLAVTVPGEPDTLDVERLFRKLYWAPPEGAGGPMVDPGIPFLAALLKRHGGGCELVWGAGRWTLEAWLPGAPA